MHLHLHLHLINPHLYLHLHLIQMLLMKLQAYGLSVKACALISSYLSGRRQQVRLGPHCSDLCDIIKGVPQGSIPGPLLFNIFINDIFHVLYRSSLHNYADDNTL